MNNQPPSPSPEEPQSSGEPTGGVPPVPQPPAPLRLPPLPAPIPQSTKGEERQGSSGPFAALSEKERRWLVILGLGLAGVFILPLLFNGPKSTYSEVEMPPARDGHKPNVSEIEKEAQERKEFEDSIDIKEEPVEIGPDHLQYYNLVVSYHAKGFSSVTKTFSDLREGMDGVYRECLSDKKRLIASIKLTAQLSLNDNGKDLGWCDVYRTSLPVLGINRDNLDAVNFTKLWNVTFIHPLFEGLKNKLPFPTEKPVQDIPHPQKAQVQNTLSAIETLVNKGFPNQRYSHDTLDPDLAYIDLRHEDERKTWDEQITGKCELISVKPAEIGPDHLQYYHVQIRFWANNTLNDEKTFLTIRQKMDDIYRTILGQTDLNIASIRTEASLNITDQFGNAYWHIVYGTSLPPGTMTRINRDNLRAVDFKKIWSVTSIHPIFGRSIDPAQDNR